MEARLHELIALAALAALGCGLALEVGDFGAIFGAAGAVATTEAIRRSPCF
jgi:alkylhydroperoxidase/carboxymuconolactone decarboxylase family protein YurZ